MKKSILKEQIREKTKNQVLDNFKRPSWLIETFLKLELRPVKLELYQKQIADVQSQFLCINKSRRIGWSALITMLGVLKANLYYDYHKYFVSYNLEEAKDRIRIARMAYADMPEKINGVRIKKKLRGDSKTILEFEDWNGKSVSRLLSFPCRDLRGGKGDVDLDEFEFYQNQHSIYKSAIFVIGRGGDHIPGGWRLSIGSTPLSKKSLFFRILKLVDEYTEFVRFEIPWWHSEHLSIKPFGDDGSIALAPYMTTEERVEVYGTPIIKSLFASSLLEDFQQEMELSFQDEKMSFLSYDMIRNCMPDGSKKRIEIKGDDIVDDGIIEDPTVFDLRMNKAEVPSFKTLDQFLINYDLKKHGIIYGGFDVGRRRHASELFLIGFIDGVFVGWLSETLQNVDFGTQKDYLRRLLSAGMVVRLCMDETGLGMDISETMQKEFPLLVEKVTFTPAQKELLANGLYLAFERKDFLLMNDKDVFNQLHSIKRTLTHTRTAKFDADSDEKSHADKFWALALAYYGYSGGKLYPVEVFDKTLEEMGYNTVKTQAGETKIIVPDTPMNQNDFFQNLADSIYGDN